MHPLNDYVWMKEYELNRLPDVLARAERHRVLMEAGLLRRRAPSAWLSCHVCRSLWRLGRSLVSAGQRLERRYAPAALRPSQG